MLIEVSTIYDPTQPVETIGMAVANRIVDALQSVPQDESVRVSLAGVRGAGSSFYNVVLRGVEKWVGMQALETRVRFEFDLKPQEFVFGQSLRALRAERRSSGSRS
jgi:hypothetical protein